jgi:SRSO17 transposase
VGPPLAGLHAIRRYTRSASRDVAGSATITWKVDFITELKSIEPIALNVGTGQVSAMQKFINIAPWDHADVQAVFAEELVPTAADGPVGVVGVVDESAFSKKGDQSAGVERQHNGRLGKEDNCQVGVYRVGVTPGGAALLDHELYLPETWCADTKECRDRRAKAHIPEPVGFQT